MNQLQLMNALAALISGGAKAAPAKTAKRSKSKRSDGRMTKEAYEVAVIKGLNAKGIATKDIELRVNVLPYKGWLEKGRIVSKGQHGVRGLFHVSQTEPYQASVQAQPANVVPMKLDANGQVSPETVAAFKANQAALDGEFGPRA
jgi:hypothetical protein